MRVIGVGAIVGAWKAGAPVWFVIVLTVAVLIMCALQMEPALVDAFNRLFRRRGDEPPVEGKSSPDVLESGQESQAGTPDTQAPPPRRRRKRRRRRRKKDDPPQMGV